MADIVTPFRFKPFGEQILITNEVGDFTFTDGEFIERFATDAMTATDRRQMESISAIVSPNEPWRITSLGRRLRKRHRSANAGIQYLIVIPTLRCNLSCAYCQVSRAPLTAEGFDWTDQQIQQFEVFLQTLPGPRLKVEFQGGEPSLRPDLLMRLIEVVRRRFDKPEFVICTNLIELTPAFREVLRQPDVTISTSIDGDIEATTSNRTASDETSHQFFTNLRHVIATYGPSKVSALPTITEATIDKPAATVDLYANLGFHGVFLRPVNYMGFARKQHAALSHDIAKWNKFYFLALDHIKEVNRTRYFEEFYLALQLRSIFAGLGTGFVDYRSPSRFGLDYCVIDFDGQIYPTDEARMLSRVRHVDLAIGSLSTGLARKRADELNAGAMHQGNPDCVHCAYLPYCGIDVIDDLSRYGRVDLPKDDTWFCRKQISLFDFIFEKIAERDKDYLDLFLKWIYRREDPPLTYELFYDSTAFQSDI
ncbi:His-Xaa-Ser system radical SAM maturase HxsB [Dongia sp.]|uniref:His-Xaa-Ser system radical SAM maturase HxsB n=1 Tax=Dongia sp. TaxID=1977262 RepID=UPI0035ADDDFD